MYVMDHPTSECLLLRVTDSTVKLSYFWLNPLNLRNQIEVSSVIQCATAIFLMHIKQQQKRRLRVITVVGCIFWKEVNQCKLRRPKQE